MTQQLIDNVSQEVCPHNSRFFCPHCGIKKQTLLECPVPLFWTTHRKGKLYVYRQYWEDVKKFVSEGKQLGISPSELYPHIDSDSRQVRNWKVGKNFPKLFSDDEFSFSPHNLYFLGIYFSDGHLRNNGSELSFTYQTGSSNIFQGYWYPQFVQRFFPIFNNKKSLSNTYLHNRNGYLSFWINLSSMSPIFIKKMIASDLIGKTNTSKTSGWKKYIPEIFLKKLPSCHEYFQGIFDGDGHYSLSRSPAISLATDPAVDYSSLIKVLDLIPTSAKQDNRLTIPYHKRRDNRLYSIDLSPSGLHNLSPEHSAADVVRQLNFLIEAAHHSIRPDKVHKLVSIVRRVCSPEYGEYRNCLPIQEKIRKNALKTRLGKKADTLLERYPVEEGRFLPFMPKWAENLCSKEEAWKFFVKKENLVFRSNHLFEKLDFGKGIPMANEKPQNPVFLPLASSS